MIDDSRSFHWKFYFVMGLTLVRVPLIFLFLCVSVFGGHPLPAPWFIVAFSAMILSALTDLFDGYFARRFKVTSRLGSYADPMMDKVFYLATFPTLVYLAEQLGQGGHARALLILQFCFCCAISGFRSFAPLAPFTI
jgi:phosphatidylglycerophosphate synthase